jgi:hypothetical protein
MTLRHSMSRQRGDRTRAHRLQCVVVDVAHVRLVELDTAWRRSRAAGTLTAHLEGTACCDMLRRPCRLRPCELRPRRESRAWGRVLGARICILAGPARCPGLRTPCWHTQRWLPAELFAQARRPMTAGSGAFGQRSYGTRRNLLLSHPVPGQPRRPHTPCTGKGCLTESITAAPVDEPRIAGGLGVTCVPAGDGSTRRRLPRRRAGVRHKSSLSAHPAATMSESSNERISGHRSAVGSASSAFWRQGVLPCTPRRVLPPRWELLVREAGSGRPRWPSISLRQLLSYEWTTTRQFS